MTTPIGGVAKPSTANPPAVVVDEFPDEERMHDPRPDCRPSLYDEAWAISDYESRLVSLRTFWADDGLYVDPDVPEGVRVRKRSQPKSSDS